MDKKKQIGMLIGVFVVLLGALAAGVGIRRFLSQRSEAKAPKPQVQRRESEPAAVVAPEDEKLTDITDEDEEFLRWVNEKMAEEEEAGPEVEEAEAEVEEYVSQKEPAVAVVEEEGAILEQQGRMAQGFGGWRSIWADLNLTEEEQERLREGFRLVMEKWQNMSGEEREAEMERMREQGDRWQNMSDEEREDAMERMRDKFEEWRQSGEVELPEFTLD